MYKISLKDIIKLSLTTAMMIDSLSLHPSHSLGVIGHFKTTHQQ